MKEQLQAIVTVLSLVNPAVCGAMFARIEANRVSRKAVGRCREGGAGHETLLADGKLKVRDAAAVLGVSERTLFRELRAERDRKMVMPSKAPEMVS